VASNAEERDISEIAKLGQRYDFNRGTIAMLVDGFGPDDRARSPSDQGGNTAHRILGHLACAPLRVLTPLAAIHHEPPSRSPYLGASSPLPSLRVLSDPTGRLRARRSRTADLPAIYDDLDGGS